MTDYGAGAQNVKPMITPTANMPGNTAPMNQLPAQSMGNSMSQPPMAPSNYKVNRWRIHPTFYHQIKIANGRI